MRRLAALIVVACIVLGGCSAPTGQRVFTARFTRAVQVFPAVKVRVLGVDVGRVISVKNMRGAVEVKFRLDDPDIEVPSDVKAAVVPMSLLGERYIQLFPAYTGGPVLKDGATIPLSRTAVPAEPDELLRSLQDYLGNLDPENVASFIENAATTLDGTGEDLNRLLEHGASVMATLSSKRDDLAQLIVELNKLTLALASRQEAIARLIHSYNAVTGTLNDNRTTLEGTIDGLSEASAQLASLLIAHRQPLHSDVRALTRTGRTLDRNVETLADTGQWATRLFKAASRAVDYQRDWLRLGNQGQELAALILLRLKQRLVELCVQSGAPECSTDDFWEDHIPDLFCFLQECPKQKGSSASALTRAIRGVPTLNRLLTGRASKEGTSVEVLMQDLLRRTVGNPYGLGGGT